METLADRIKTRREELDLSQSDLARVVGVSPAAVNQWESGSTKNLKNDHLFLVSDALNVAPRWLATGLGPKDAHPSKAAYKLALSRRDSSSSQSEKVGWERIAASLAKAAMVMVFTIPPFLPNPADAAVVRPNETALCIMFNRVLQRIKAALDHIFNNSRLAVSYQSA